MNEQTTPEEPREKEKSGSGCMRTLTIAGIVALVVVVVVAVWVKYNIYASPYLPTILSDKEQNSLDSKISLLTNNSQGQAPVHRSSSRNPDDLTPEPYSELGLKREISITEKELNSLLTTEGEPARFVALDLSEGLVSVKLVIPVDNEVLLLGGKTLRINMGILLKYAEGRPVVGIKGVSLGGIPMPNAWLGYLKGKNLIDEFGTEEGFWHLFAEGVRDITVREGHLRIRLKE